MGALIVELLVLAGVGGVIHALYSRLVEWAVGSDRESEQQQG